MGVGGGWEWGGGVKLGGSLGQLFGWFRAGQ